MVLRFAKCEIPARSPFLESDCWHPGAYDVRHFSKAITQNVGWCETGTEGREAGTRCQDRERWDFGDSNKITITRLLLGSNNPLSDHLSSPRMCFPPSNNSTLKKTKQNPCLDLAWHTRGVHEYLVTFPVASHGSERWSELLRHSQVLSRGPALHRLEQNLGRKDGHRPKRKMGQEFQGDQRSYFIFWGELAQLMVCYHIFSDSQKIRTEPFPF